jgi:hypothetical protein
MKLVAIFGIVALLPAALNTTPASARGQLAVPLCTGDGVARTVNVPVGQSGPPSSDPPGCCVKGCHSGGARKRLNKRLDQAQ